MAKLVWDAIGERYYETGVDRGVVYPQDSKGEYPQGEAWNGLITATISPSGAEPTALWANNHKYTNLISAEEVSGTIEAYTYPEGFAKCNGELEAVKGVRFGQQKRVPFGFSFRTMIGNDTEGNSYGYKIHIIYGATASPSENSSTTINDSPEAKTMSWEFTTVPVEITGLEGFSALSHIEIDSTAVDPERLEAFEEILYGSDNIEPRLPMPNEIVEHFENSGE